MGWGLTDGRRRIATAILALPMAAAALAQQPVLVPATLVRHVWCVPATIDGRRASLLVDTGADDTIVLPGPWKQAHKGVIRIDRLEIRTNIRVMDLPVLRALAPDMKAPVVGILGMDVLRDMAVGFDAVHGTVAFWPQRGLPLNTVRSWLQAAHPWPGRKEVGVRVLRLDLSMGHRRGITCMIGGKAARLIVDTGSSGATLIEQLAKGAGAVTAYSEPLHALYASSPSKAQVASTVAVGNEQRHWLFFRTQPASAYRGQPGGPQGVLGLASLQSRRTVFDFGQNLLFLEDSGEEARLSLFLTELIELPVRLAGNGLRIGPATLGPAASFLKPIEGREVVSIAGIPAAQMVATLRRFGGKSLEPIAKIIRATRRAYWVVVRQGKGTYRFQVRRG